MAHETHLSGPTSAPEVLSQVKTGRPLTNVPSAHTIHLLDEVSCLKMPTTTTLEKLHRYFHR